METHRLVMGGGFALFVVMAVLLRVGTRSLPLFIAYAALAAAGMVMIILGQKMRDRR